MANLKRVGPGSAFKIGLIVYGLLGLIIGACFSLVATRGGPASPRAGRPDRTAAG